MLELGKLDNHSEVSRKMGKTKIGIEEGDQEILKVIVMSRKFYSMDPSIRGLGTSRKAREERKAEYYFSLLLKGRHPLTYLRLGAKEGGGGQAPDNTNKI